MKYLFTIISLAVISILIYSNLFSQTLEPLKNLVHTTESITATVWNDGFIGPNQPAGLPGTFAWKGTKGLWESGFVYGTASVGAVTGSYGESSNYIDDWRNVESDFVGGFTEEIAGIVTFDQVSTAKIDDSGAPQDYKFGINVLQKSYSKSDENVVFFRYGFINTTGEDIADLYVGHTTDWNIGNYIYNAGGIDLSLNLTYLSKTDSTGPYYGVVVIDSLIGCKIANSIPSNLREETFNYISVFDSTIPTTGNLRTVGGTYINYLAQNETAWVTFAYIAGDDLEGLKANANRAIEIAEDAGWKDTPVSVDANDKIILENFVLHQNYPNPFNPSTTIKYEIPSVASDFSLSNVTLKVYDILGREVATLVNQQQTPGYYEVNFNASSLTSGIYFYHIAIHSDKINAGSFVETKKMILLR